MQHPKAPQVIRLGHPSRLTPDTLEVTLLVLGHLVVFFLSLAHDEITAELVEDGWLMASLSERFEILIGLVLFLCWSALLLRLVHVLRRVREDALPEQSDS
ncbi:hypothetical protein [Thalassococcus sp. S3]|uniref:hypothetical protein n=1 Tax=Thalassococcus sp. S3 TaxID=2017482 RepID=UPI00102B11BD|nr:hypothetical protein [Thalassococcus sp. S3]